MKTKLFYCFLVLIFSLTFFSALCQPGPKVSNTEDSVCKTINSIIQERYKLDSIATFAMIYDSNTPEDWYALFTIDTVAGKLLRANSYVHKGKFKYLTIYYYFNDKLILTNTSKSLIKNQESKKWINWHSEYSYWNDSLVCASPTNYEYFDYKNNLKIAYEILNRFKIIYSGQRLYFEKNSNIGRFK